MDGNENVKKRKKGLISKTTSSHVHHTFLYIPFPFFHDHDVKMPISRFMQRRNFISRSELGDGPLKYSFIWQSKWVGIIAIKTERTESHFLSDVLVAAASLDLNVPIVLTWPGQSVYVEKRWSSQEGDSSSQANFSFLI